MGSGPGAGLMLAFGAPSTEQAIAHSQQRQAASRENQARTQVLSKEVQHLQEEKSRQVRTALL